jgi:hypothetical protein
MFSCSQSDSYRFLPCRETSGRPLNSTVLYISIDDDTSRVTAGDEGPSCDRVVELQGEVQPISLSRHHPGVDVGALATRLIGRSLHPNNWG